jgi:hypothetical protein
MRVIDVPEKADILVSELLGSFGDNELSPECLDGAMRFLKRMSTSYLAHIFYSNLTFLLWLLSKWYIYPLFVHGPSCTAVIFQAIQRSPVDQKRQEPGDAVRGDVPSGQHSERDKGVCGWTVWAAGSGVLGIRASEKGCRS